MSESADQIAKHWLEWFLWPDNLDKDTLSRDILPLIRKFILYTQVAQTSPRDRLAMAQAAVIADAQMRAILSSSQGLTGKPATASPVGKFYLLPELLARMGMQVDASTNASTLLAASGSTPPAETRSVDYQYAALILLAVLSWLIFLAGPAMIAKLPSSDQAAVTDYWSAVPGIAVALTGYILTQRKRK